MVKKEEKKRKSGGDLESTSSRDRLFLDTVMKNLKKGMDSYKHNVDQAKEDLEFLNGDQWEKGERDRRKRRKRPVLTINMLPDKVDKIVGDMRQNRARVKVRAASSDADSQIARIREGMIMDIEYTSMASSIYDYAGGRMVECGEGAWRILTRWCEDNPFIQEIYIKLIKNSFMVIIDPDATGVFKEDAKWAFILSKISKDAFKEQYPNKQLPSSQLEIGDGMGKEHWYDGETITIAEYFEVKLEEKLMALMNDGLVMEKSAAEERIKEWEKQWILKIESDSINPEGPLVQSQPSPPPHGSPNMPGVPPLSQITGNTPPNMPMDMGPIGGNVTSPKLIIGAPKPGAPPKPEILKEKTTKVRKVYWYKLTACDILEGRKTVPGKYIPIVKVTGKERNIEGKDYIRGAIRDAKDPQRLVNYWNTSAAETIALAPKAPWVGTAKQFEGYEEDYANSNVENYPFLKYNPDSDAPGPPQRQRAAEPPVAIFTQIQISERNLNTVVGMGPDLRDVAPDASAKSIIQRQKPAELSTFPFVDNLASAQKYTYIIINEMIPEVYDTERDIKVRGLDESEYYVPINMSAKKALELIQRNPERYKGMDALKLRESILQYGIDSKFNSIGSGRYEIVIDVGPSFATQRQESADKFVTLTQTNPKLWNIAGDLIVKNLDVEGADEIASRIRKTLPPGLVTPKPGEQLTSAQKPNPQLILITEKAKTERIKQQKELIKQRVEMIRQKTELIRQYNETKDSDREIRGRILQVLSELYNTGNDSEGTIQEIEPQQ